MAGCRGKKRFASQRLAGGGVEFEKRFVDKTGRHRGILVERFLPTKDSIRWELEVRGQGRTVEHADRNEPELAASRAEPLLDRLGRSPARRQRLDESPASGRMARPRVFLRRTQSYFKEPGTFSLPLATILDEKRDAGLSLVLSPDDLVLTMKMRTTKQGNADLLAGTSSARQGRTWSAGDGSDVRIRPIGAAALGWLARRYPPYFDPPNPAAQQMAGCGAYSSHADINEPSG